MKLVAYTLRTRRCTMKKKDIEALKSEMLDGFQGGPNGGGREVSHKVMRMQQWFQTRNAGKTGYPGLRMRM